MSLGSWIQIRYLAEISTNLPALGSIIYCSGIDVWFKGYENGGERDLICQYDQGKKLMGLLYVINQVLYWATLAIKICKVFFEFIKCFNTGYS